MNSQSFADALNKYLIPEARSATIKELANPTALTPDPVLKLSDRFNSMSDTDKDFVSEVVALAAKTAIFHLLVAIDNCNTIIEDASDRTGEFQLYFAKGNEKVRLGEPPEFLHDML